MVPNTGAAVVRTGADRGALGADQGDEQVDEPHEQAAENTRFGGVHRHPLGLRNTVFSDNINDHDAEGQPCQSIQGVIAFQEAPEEGGAGGSIVFRRSHGGNGTDGLCQGGNDQHCQKYQEHRIQPFSDPGHDSAGLQGEIEHHRKEDQGEQCQIQPLPLLRQQVYRPHGESGAGAPGNGEQRPDGQIQQGAEKQTVLSGHPLGQLHHALAAAEPQAHHCQHGNAHGGDEHTGKGAPHIASRVQTHLCRENQISGSEKHAEQHTGDNNSFLQRQISLHRIPSTSW